LATNADCEYIVLASRNIADFVTSLKGCDCYFSVILLKISIGKKKK